MRVSQWYDGSGEQCRQEGVQRSGNGGKQACGGGEEGTNHCERGDEEWRNHSVQAIQSFQAEKIETVKGQPKGCIQKNIPEKDGWCFAFIVGYLFVVGLNTTTNDRT